MGDILNNTKLSNDLGKTMKAEGSGEPEPSQTSDNKASVEDFLDRGSDIIKRAGNSGTQAAATDQSHNAGEVEPKSDSAKKEETSSKNDVEDPNSWTLDSAFKEIKKLREENKHARLQREKLSEEYKASMEAKLKTFQDELEEARQAKKELDKIKFNEQDKKKSLEEKLADRERRLAEFETKYESTLNSYKSEIEARDSRLKQYEADFEAQKEMYKKRLEKELSSIPEKYRDHADLIVKGAGDPRDAIVALNEAKIKGMFEDKTVIVNHSVPGAGDGARATKEKLEEAAKAERAKMSPQQKIGVAIKDVFSGGTNSAFKIK